MLEDEVKARMLEEYIEYWEEKSAAEVKNNKDYQKFTEDMEKRYQIILEMILPWQRKLVTGLIDEIKSLENARSSIEMDNVIKLIYESKE